MDHAYLSPFVVIVIVFSALCYVGFLTYVIRDHLAMRRYAKNNPVGGKAAKEAEFLMPNIDV
jgi:hypothetical protein